MVAPFLSVGGGAGGDQRIFMDNSTYAPLDNPRPPASAEGRPSTPGGRLPPLTSGNMNARGADSVPPPCPRVLVFSCEQRHLSSLSPFQRKDACDRFGKVTRCDKLRDGAIEVEFAHAADAAKAMKSTSFTYHVRDGAGRREVSLPVTVAPHRTKNFTKGIINCFDLRDVSEDEMVEGLSRFGVTEARRIVSKRGGVTIPTNNIVLTFSSLDLPSEVVVGYVRVKVRAFIPNPMRCFRCQRFGHTKTHCRNRPACAKCASLEHTDEECRSETFRCVNCEGQAQHTSYDRTCPTYEKEREINAIKATKKVTFREAREIYNQAHPKVSYAQKASKAPVPNLASLEQLSASQLVQLLKAFGLSVVAAGSPPVVAAAPVEPPSTSMTVPPSPPGSTLGGEAPSPREGPAVPPPPSPPGGIPPPMGPPPPPPSQAAGANTGVGEGAWTEVRRRRAGEHRASPPPPPQSPENVTPAPASTRPIVASLPTVPDNGPALTPAPSPALKTPSEQKQLKPKLTSRPAGRDTDPSPRSTDPSPRRRIEAPPLSPPRKPPPPPPPLARTCRDLQIPPFRGRPEKRGPAGAGFSPPERASPSSRRKLTAAAGRQTPSDVLRPAKGAADFF